MGGTAKRLAILSEFCTIRLAREVAALHLALAAPLDDFSNLAPVRVPAVALRMVLQPPWTNSAVRSRRGRALGPGA
jgi:hypothetical protein